MTVLENKPSENLMLKYLNIFKIIDFREGESWDPAWRGGEAAFNQLRTGVTAVIERQFKKKCLPL